MKLIGRFSMVVLKVGVSIQVNNLKILNLILKDDGTCCF